MKAKKTLLIWLLSSMVNCIYAQLTIEECYEKARKNYPLIREYNLIGISEGYNLRNASKGYLPQIGVTAKATYQTDVTAISANIPGIDIPKINKDQYQAIAEISQTIWDGGEIYAGRKAIKAEHEVEYQQYETDMYALKARINDLFFGILMLDEQLKLNDIYREELQSNKEKINTYINNGIANQSDLDIIEAELLNNYQQQIEFTITRKAYCQMLANFTGESSDSNSKLKKPNISYATIYDSSSLSWVNRPENALFDAQVKYLKSQKESIQAKNLPKLNAFIQGGYGNPGLNMFKEGFEAYAIGGVKFAWNFGGLYTRKNDLGKIRNSIDRIEVQRDIFNFNNHLQVTQANAEMKKYEQLITEDKKLITLRNNIKKVSQAKVGNGTMSIHDLVRDITAEQAALQKKSIHEIEMIKSVYEIKNILNDK